MSLLLASASPRRAELLSQLGVDFRQASIDIDETPFEHEAAVDYVERMAYEKAQSAMQFYAGNNLVILAADTTVVLGGRILGKPKDFDDFAGMMKSLSGQKHQVFTAVSVVKESDGHIVEGKLLNESSVQFTTLKDEDIAWYWQTNEPGDKAGGYGIQGQGGRFVESIQGSYTGIVGLPLYETAEILTKFGILSINADK